MITTREIRFFGDSKYLIEDKDRFLKSCSAGAYYESRLCFEQEDRKVYWRYLRDFDDSYLVSGMQMTQVSFHWSCNPESINLVLSRLRGSHESKA